MNSDSVRFAEFKLHAEMMMNAMECAPGADGPRVHEFKHHTLLLMNAMERTIRRSHPKVRHPGAQSDEDRIIGELLTDDRGVYVDVGAAEPVECSNTWRLYQRGWRGLLVECLPTAWHALLRHRPGDYLCPLAAMDAPGWARLRVANTVSSVRVDWDIAEQAEIIVECDTLANILAAHPRIRDECSLLSIDVEGAERQVLAGIDFAAFRPRVVIVEKYRYHPSDAEAEAWRAAHPGESDDLSGEWERLLTGAGYRLHAQNALNNVYVIR